MIVVQKAIACLSRHRGEDNLCTSAAELVTNNCTEPICSQLPPNFKPSSSTETKPFHCTATLRPTCGVRQTEGKSREEGNLLKKGKEERRWKGVERTGGEMEGRGGTERGGKGSWKGGRRGDWREAKGGKKKKMKKYVKAFPLQNAKGKQGEIITVGTIGLVHEVVR